MILRGAIRNGVPTAWAHLIIFFISDPFNSNVNSITQLPAPTVNVLLLFTVKYKIIADYSTVDVLFTVNNRQLYLYYRKLYL